MKRRDDNASAQVTELWGSTEWPVVSPANWAFNPPLYDSTSYALPSVEAWENFLSGSSEAWCYSSDGHPTGVALQSYLAKLQMRSNCLLTATGKSAIARTLLGLLSSGDEVIILKEAYKSTRFFAEKVLSKFGVGVHLVSIDEVDRIESLLARDAVRILMLESPTNPQCRVPNLHGLSELAHAANTLVVLDNSMSGFHQHGKLPVDIFVHSLSKFASSAVDVMGGAIITNQKLMKEIESGCQWGADVLDPRAAQNILKGMVTYSLRRDRQSSSALQIAQILSQHPKVERVLYPGLESHPDYEYAVQQMSDYGVIISFDYAGNEFETKEMINKLENFKIAFGSAYPTSIVSPGFLFYTRSFPECEIEMYGVQKNTVRLSIGLEPLESLISDLQHAL